MSEWLAFIPAVAAAIGVLFVPGLVLGVALRLRGWWLVAASAPLSVSLIVVASIVAGWIGLRWTALPVLALTAIAVIAAWCWARWVGNPLSRPTSGARRRAIAPAVIGFLAGAVPIGWVLVRGMGDPQLIAQRYDNFFHVNAIQYVLDTGSASPFWVGTMTAPGNLLFYPSGWHAAGSLVAQLCGCGVGMASNALILVTAAAVWPLAVILLARTLFGGSALVTVAAGALSGATPAFPYLPLHYGPLYPLFLGLAIAPVSIAALIRLLRPGRIARRHDIALLAVLLTPGVAVAHPGALLAVLALTVPSVVMLGWWLWRRTSTLRWRLWIILGGVSFAVTAMIVLRFVRPPASEIYWPPTGTLPTAVGEIVTAALFGYPVAYLFAGLVLVAVVRCCRRPAYGRSVALGMGFVGAFLYIVVAGSPFEELRMWLTGPWYNNAPRLASIWALGAVPLAAGGVAVLVRWAARRARRMSAPSLAAPVVRRAGLLVLAIAIVTLSHSGALRQASADVHFVYGDDGGGPILSAGEYRLLEHVDDLVPEDAVIAGDPWTGTSFAYGISGRKVLMPHLLMDETSPARLINERFATDADEPEMCEALRETGVRYILDFDGPDLMENEGGFDGVSDLRESPFVELVASESGARLYRITTCGLEK
ncbi:DUF6541 family protein [Microbacterium neungamense]|uniref:DUF6541 family protein n=1 Tax=Microbacterium neungamense TaxID=2810535 RepID=UPI00217E6DB7|nr:DUF6541 family protein [Microbacterium neungamense]UWF78173.1 hypothetical protein JSY13_03860 [Microbacterium neungamense]